MPYSICEHCAFETQDPAKTDLRVLQVGAAPEVPLLRGRTIEKERTIYCGHCGEKLKISIVPIQ